MVCKNAPRWRGRAGKVLVNGNEVGFYLAKI